MKKLLIVALIAAGVGGGVYYANHVAAQEVKSVIDEQLAMVSEQSAVDVAYKDISASVFTHSFELSGISLTNSMTGKSIADIESIEVSGYETEKVSPHTELKLSEMRFTDDFLSMLPLDSQNRLATATYDMNSSMDYDEDSGDSEFALNIVANDIVDVSLDVGLAGSKALIELSQSMQNQNVQNMPMEQQLQLQSKLMAAMTELEPRAIEFKVKNDGELKAAMDTLIEARGLTHEQFKEKVARDLRRGAAMSDELRTALMNFATGLESLSISVKLPEGQNIMALNQQMMKFRGQPEKLAEFINLEAKGE